MARNCNTRTAEAPSAAFNAQRVTVKSGGSQLAGKDPDRRTVTIVNDPDSVGDLYFGPNPASARVGFRIPPGGGFTLTTAAPVYGVAVGGEVTAGVVSESGSVG